MYRRVAVAACLTAFLALAMTSSGVAGKFNKKLDIGDKAPGFEGIIGVDGESHSLGDYKKAKAVVICFTCNKCPVAVAYEDRFVKFTKEYKDKGVEFVAINVNRAEADGLEKMKERAEQQGFNFAYLYDESQESGRAYGATVTPHMFVLDKDRKVAYMGKFDDSQDTEKVKAEYVRDAVDSVLAGKPVEVTETRQVGCGIGYEN